MIAILISAYKSLFQIKKLIDFFDSEKFIILIHINKISNENLHKEIKEYIKYKTKSKIYYINPINVYWSHFSHVEQKFNAMNFLIINNIKFDYFINITENDCPIKSADEIYDFIMINKEKSFFVDFYQTQKDFEQYYENVKFFGDIKKKLRLINNEILVCKRSLNSNWYWEFHPRNNIVEYKKKRNKLALLNSIFIVTYLLLPSKLTFWLAQNYYFYSNKSNDKKYKKYTEWQYSITSFFSYDFVKFIIKKQSLIFSNSFKNIYAPDESVWITIAKNFNFNNCIYNWKPLLLSTYTMSKNRDGTRPYLSWSSNNLITLIKNDCKIKNKWGGNELFCRRTPNERVFNQILELIDKNKN